jgi:Plasmid encoded RepA protein
MEKETPEEVKKATRSLAERRQQDQDQLSFDILTNPPSKDGNGNVIGYTPYFTTQFGLPHRAVEGDKWERKNGSQKLRITSTSGAGIPWGSKPRLLIAWVATWQVRHPKETVIELGKNVSHFLEKELGVPRTGKYISEVKKQMRMLFSSTISITTDEPKAGHWQHRATQIADDYDVWESKKGVDQDALFNSYIILTDRFRESLLANPVPIDLRVFPILTPSPLAVDYYVWLARVMFNLRQSRMVTWKQLHGQFGAQYSVEDRFGIHNFAKESQTQLKTRVMRAYPTLRLSFPSDGKGIWLHPSPTPVPIAPKKTITMPAGTPAKKLIPPS